ncbi:hypothetical protein QCE62_08905 [Caballeronia sp. LZ033]|uniref:hypothetical protein n=1 Tax=Caballeronia sp. LZ033 TaxID=3038566 RepID=UPI00285729B8|nr:hypothetical protein [Caballeronia sp. LZ033]MDR5813708.1 hypothetical protein [Caballeronia sp. LZ033]
MLSSFNFSNASSQSYQGMSGAPLAPRVVTTRSGTTQSSSDTGSNYSTSSSSSVSAPPTPYPLTPTAFYGSDSNTDEFSSMMNDPNVVAQMRDAAVDRAGQILAAQGAQQVAPQIVQPQIVQPQIVQPQIVQPQDTQAQAPAEQQTQGPLTAALHDVANFGQHVLQTALQPLAGLADLVK